MLRGLRARAGAATAALALAAAAAVVTTTDLVAADAKPTKEALLNSASRYVATFVERFTNVVAEERYMQDWKTNAGVLLVHRELKGDFLLTRPAPTAPWLAFRDVFEVDGEKVRDRFRIDELLPEADGKGVGGSRVDYARERALQREQRVAHDQPAALHDDLSADRLPSEVCLPGRKARQDGRTERVDPASTRKSPARPSSAARRIATCPQKAASGLMRKPDAWPRPKFSSKTTCRARS